jgi:transposase
LPAEQVAAGIVAEISGEILKLKERIAAADAEIEERSRVHSMAKLLTSLPGMGTRLGAEFLMTVGDPRGKLTGADQLASFAGLAPATRDSGKRTGNNRRMRGYLHTSSVRIPAAVHVDHLARDIGGAIT